MSYFLVFKGDSGFTHWRTIHPESNINAMCYDLDLVPGQSKLLKKLLTQDKIKTMPIRSYKYRVIVARRMGLKGLVC